mmetsp:Transcript_17987/g.41601  ORF Transcript_17987/g.41601 Transcript_17987/m.41601 type:complete len:203 (+) Transcript_17987:632-1240(+)
MCAAITTTIEKGRRFSIRRVTIRGNFATLAPHSRLAFGTSRHGNNPLLLWVALTNNFVGHNRAIFLCTWTNRIVAHKGGLRGGASVLEHGEASEGETQAEFASWVFEFLQFVKRSVGVGLKRPGCSIFVGLLCGRRQTVKSRKGNDDSTRLEQAKQPSQIVIQCWTLLCRRPTSKYTIVIVTKHHVDVLREKLSVLRKLELA